MAIRREVDPGVIRTEVRTTDSSSPMAEASAVRRVEEVPVIQEQVVQEQVVQAVPVQQVPVQAVPVQRVETIPTVGHAGYSVRQARTWRFEPAAIVTGAIGVLLLIMGLIAMARGGFDGPLNDPIFEVGGFTFTTTLGIVVAIAGLILMICGFSNAREASMFFGAVIGIAGVVAAIQSESFDDNLAIESSFAWLMVAAGVVVLLANALLPSTTRRSTVYEQV